MMNIVEPKNEKFKRQNDECKRVVTLEFYIHYFKF